MTSLTIWSRLEPRTREFTMERALQAQVRDPLWMLTRQWQVGEFLADDAGSAISATVRTESVPLTSFRPGTALAGQPVQPISSAPPLEVHAEREPVAFSLRAAIALGLRFETFLADEGAGTHAGAFRTAYPIAAAPPADEVADPQGARWRALAAGRALDGAALVTAAHGIADLTTVAPIPSLPSNADRSAAGRALGRLVAHSGALVTQPAGDSSWAPERLEHSFSVGSETEAGSIQLAAPRFGGGHLDWYSFTAVSDPLGPANTGRPVTIEQRSFIPNTISFQGMPNSRWWNFEDGATDFGKLDVEHVDLAKLIVMEFALVSGDDWFELPLRVPAGTLTHVDTLIVTDVFGERTILSPTAAMVPPGERPWAMFDLTGIPPEHDLLFVPPVLGDVLDGPELEDVLFVRDEMAAMGWAIERTLAGPLDRPIDGYARWHARLAATPPPPARTHTPDEPAIEYVTGTDVPDNWIPLVPVPTSASTFHFRRGIMGGPTPSPARGRVLEPERRPYYVDDNAVPREGVRVTRRFRRTRWSDGSTWVWLARSAAVGRGEAASGLEFDALRDVPPTP